MQAILKNALTKKEREKKIRNRLRKESKNFQILETKNIVIIC